MHPALKFRNLLLWLPLLISYPLVASMDENQYAYASIPDSLCRNAGAVVRLSDTRIEILSAKSVRKDYHLVVTILQEDALEKAALYLTYDGYRKIQKIKGSVYNKDGKEIKRISASDFVDRSAVPDGTFHSDDRVKYFNPVYNGSYPVTFDYEVETAGEAPAFYPGWIPQQSYGLSVEKSSLTVISDEELFPRFHVLNSVPREVVQTVGGKKQVTWQFQNLPAIIREPYSPPLRDLVSGILLAPVKMNYRGFNDNFLSWNDVGSWINYLLQGRDQLPESTRNMIMRLAAAQPDSLSMVRAIYRYLQATKRYVSIQLGIGGWQPLPASFVDEQGQGDCKALVNYTKALLACIGLPSYYTLVSAGRDNSQTHPDFPSMNFNHVILCVPLQHDTIWLECTNPTMPFGFLGSFTDDRYVLVIKSSGAVLVKTPAYPGRANRMSRKSTVTLYPSGDATFDMITCYSGLQYQIVDDLARMGLEEQKTTLASSVGIPNVTIQSVTYTSDSATIPTICEHLVFLARSYASVSGDRMFVPVNPVNVRKALTLNSDKRFAPILTGYPYGDLDSVIVTIPAGYMIEGLPQNVTSETIFGNYRSTVAGEADKWIYTRSFDTEQVSFEAEEYPAFRGFINIISKADRQKAILRKSGQ